MSFLFWGWKPEDIRKLDEAVKQKETIVIHPFTQTLQDILNSIEGMKKVRQLVQNEIERPDPELSKIIKRSFEATIKDLDNKLLNEINNQDSSIKRLSHLIKKLISYESDIIKDAALKTEMTKLRSILDNIDKQLADYILNLIRFTTKILPEYKDHVGSALILGSLGDKNMYVDIEKAFDDEINKTSKIVQDLQQEIPEQYRLFLHIEAELKELEAKGLLNDDPAKKNAFIMRNKYTPEILFKELYEKIIIKNIRYNYEEMPYAKVSLGRFKIDYLENRWGGSEEEVLNIVDETNVVLLSMKKIGYSTNFSQGGVGPWFEEFLVLLNSQEKSLAA